MRGEMVARRCFVNLIEREMPFMRAIKNNRRGNWQELARVGARFGRARADATRQISGMPK
jgi:hypothetical protein